MKLSFAILLSSIAILSEAVAQQQDLKLWYNKPATTWTEALPIGNGRLGAMIYGDVNNEHIQFNEETLWTGGPREHHREGAVNYLPEIRQLLATGKQSEAETLAEKHFMGSKVNEGTYSSLKNAWLAKVQLDQSPASSNYNDSQWKVMKLPLSNGWESAGLDGVDGAVWFRSTFDLPQQWQGKNLIIALGRIRDLDITYVNGTKIGSLEGTGNREYRIDASLVKKGKNNIAIQVLNFFDKGGFVGAKNNQKVLTIYPEGEDPSSGILLDNEWKYWLQDEAPPGFPRYQADYQPFGDVWLQFKNEGKTSAYKRELNVENAISTVTYTLAGVNYTREYLASAPGQAIVINLKADKPGKISLRTLFQTPHKLSNTKKVDDRTIRLSLQVKNGALNGVSYLHVETQQGNVTVTDNAIEIENANEVTFYLAAETNFRNYQDVSGNPNETCANVIQNIRTKKYEDIKQAHIQDYQQYFKSFSLNVGSTENEKLPTDERLRQYSSVADPSLITLYLQYGRYLLISSSRPGTQPANLQGIWNNLLTPPWGSKYTTNINVQMNYWPAEALNLSSCADPLFKMIEELSEAGKLTAKHHYGAPGWVVHHNTDLWRGTSPINAANHGIWVTGGAWLCHHLWEHYLYTQDKKFLNTAYPVMKSAAEFFTSFLVKDPVTGFLISTPSNSPEQGGLVAGPTMDHQLVRDLFKNCIRASEVLGIDTEFRGQLRKYYDDIAPNKIGKHNQLQEWMEDTDDITNNHRHVSHLWGVYPGTDVTWDNASMMNAAKQSLIYRGDGGTGWSLAWKVNLWARFKDGDHTMTMIGKLLEPAIDSAGNERGGAYNNLFDAHPPFQIDGNFGGAAGIAEMLLQSHMPYIELLPALPSTLPNGEVKGVCARGGFVINMKWKDRKLQALEVISNVGNECFLKYGNKEIRFSTSKGKTYSVNNNLVLIKK